MTKKVVEKVAASFTVHEVANMTDDGRKDICKWMRRLASSILKEPESFAKTFRARYIYSNRQETK
jgi:hypothetical protein